MLRTYVRTYDEDEDGMRHPELRVATSRFSSIVIIIIPCFQKKKKERVGNFSFQKKKEKGKLLSKRWEFLFSKKKKKKNYFQSVGNLSFLKKRKITFNALEISLFQKKITFKALEISLF